MARRLDGKAVAHQIYERLAIRLERLRSKGIKPCLAAILVGADPASRLYVQNKKAACEAVGVRSEIHTFPETVTEETLLAKIRDLNRDPNIHGILVQLPLPETLSRTRVLEAVDPQKDVDGFHPVNKGRLLDGTARLVPCTPAGILQLMDTYGLEIEGRRAVVVGRSDIVGKPMALLLLHRNATVTICHSRTRNLPELVRSADILVAAVGRPALIQPDWVNPNGVVIDVGTTAVRDRSFLERILPADSPRWHAFEQRGRLLIGDVHPAAYERAAAYTPVPGGVGPLTVAMVVHNTVTAAEIQAGIA